MFNSIALKKAKIVYNFGMSECYWVNISCIFSDVSNKSEELKAVQCEVSEKETRISQLEGELNQAALDMKQLQGQLVVKEEQLIQTQENMQKVGFLILNTELFMVRQSGPRYL